MLGKARIRYQDALVQLDRALADGQSGAAYLRIVNEIRVQHNRGLVQQHELSRENVIRMYNETLQKSR